MTDETLRTLITCAFTFGGIVISNSFVYLGSRNNEKKTKRDSILEQQYNKVFTPIHKLLFFSTFSDTEKINEIRDIISDNYELVADEIREEFGTCCFYKKITRQFEKLIASCYKVTGNKLGYSKLKIDKEDRKSTKRVISSETSFSRKSYLTLLMGYIVIIITIVISMTALAKLFMDNTDMISSKYSYVIFVLTGMTSVIIFLINKRYRM